MSYLQLDLTSKIILNHLADEQENKATLRILTLHF